jgi:hypothetical protein
MLALLAALPGAAQETAVTFRADANLALLRFEVLRDGAYVDDLRSEEIEVRENGAPQKVAVFEGGRNSGRTVPLELMLLFDCSESIHTAGLLNARVFETGLFRKYPQVSVSVYGFTHTWQKYAAATREIETLNGAAREVMEAAPGGTRLYEAVILTARDAGARSAEVTRRLVVFSDSVAPRDAARLAVLAARDAGVAVYPVILGKTPEGLTSAAGNPFDRTVREFTRLGEETGGHTFRRDAANPAVLADILEWILRQLNAEYVAGIYARPGGESRLEVVLRDAARGQVRGGSRVLRVK